MSDKFKPSTWGRSDKSIDIDGPLRIMVDYDDVNHYAVDILLPQLYKILNEHWHSVPAWHCPHAESDDDWGCEGRYAWQPEPGECEHCGKTLVMEMLADAN